ncbi:MAG: tetratricopeptide repeat protein [bacterium]|nr:tetratricopeptide repeat protein [bacterium]
MRLLMEVRNLMENYHVKSGMYHYFRNEYKPAEDFLQKALKDENGLSEADRRNARHYLTLSLVDSSDKLRSEGRLEEGVERLQRAVEVSPSFPDIHFRLGRLYEEMDRIDEALAEYERAIDCNQRYLAAHVARGFCLLRAGRSDEATEVMRGALKIKQNQTKRPFDMAVRLLGQGATAEAVELFHEAFESSPQLCAEYRKSALARLDAGDYPRALSDFERAAQACPKYPDIHNFRGIVLFELDRVEEAVEAFRLSVSLSPRYLVPRLNLAFALLRAGECRQAEAELELILEQDPSEQAAAAKLEELRTGRFPERRRPSSRGSAG